MRGPQSFEALRTVNGTLYPTYKASCNAYGFLSDDKEWYEALGQFSASGCPVLIRQLFVNIIVNCKLNYIFNLWTSHWEHMVDDLIYMRRKLTRNSRLMLNIKQQQYLALVGKNKQITDYPLTYQILITFPYCLIFPSQTFEFLNYYFL